MKLYENLIRSYLLFLNIPLFGSSFFSSLSDFSVPSEESFNLGFLISFIESLSVSNVLLIGNISFTSLSPTLLQSFT